MTIRPHTDFWPLASGITLQCVSGLPVLFGSAGPFVKEAEPQPRHSEYWVFDKALISIWHDGSYYAGQDYYAIVEIQFKDGTVLGEGNEVNLFMNGLGK